MPRHNTRKRRMGEEQLHLHPRPPPSPLPPLPPSATSIADTATTTPATIATMAAAANTTPTTAPLTLTDLPDEILGRTVSFLTHEEVWSPLSRVNTRLCELATNTLRQAAQEADPVLVDMFECLHHSPKKVNKQAGRKKAGRKKGGRKVGEQEKTDIGLLRPVTLWKHLWMGREKSKASVLTEDVDYHNVRSGGEQAFSVTTPLVDAPFWIKPLSHYQFAVRIWSQRVVLEKHRLTFIEEENAAACWVRRAEPSPGSWALQLSLQKPEGASTKEMADVLLGDYYALEIFVCKRDTKDWATLYSCLHPLKPYGGGSYEGYEAMPWFSDGFDDEHGRCNFGSREEAEQWGSLPFCEAVVEASNDRASIHLQFHWRGPEGAHRGPLGLHNRLVLLHHRCNPAYKNPDDGGDYLFKIPRFLRPQATSSMEHYVPKPLEEYSFRMDIQKKSEPRDICSILFQRLPDESHLDEPGFFSLIFEIPKEDYNDFPWGDDYVDYEHVDWPDRTAETVEINEIVSVYAIDRHTGKQAKLYQSGLCMFDELYIDFLSFMEFEKSAALSQYSFGDDRSGIPVPSTGGVMLDPWKHDNIDSDGADDMRTFQLCLNFQYFSGQGEGTGDAIAHTEASKDDMLVFLEKGLTYK